MTATTCAGFPVRGLTRTGPSPAGPVRAAASVDLDMSPGGTVALPGPNGAGKSTTIDIMLGLLRPRRAA